MRNITLNEEAIFHEARKIEQADARIAFLERVCGGDRLLYDRVVELLGGLTEFEQFLEAPPSICSGEFTATVDPSVAEKVGAQIGAYKLLEELGEGGMGVVYMAEQKQPVRRLVALKIVKPGMDSRQVIARFDAERQTLALMDHPGIARILDAGTTELGRPYFVMELVRGVPINEFCDQNRFTVRQRLELFLKVCQAVQHAHQKGIIHRDLKPTNVLVTKLDVVAVPKVIDFGIAKAFGSQLTDHTKVTGFYQFLGTPQYMSPEQADMNQLGVDTRSDVYSLGVMLYELLTGGTPFEKHTLKSSNFDELRRILLEEEPPNPSSRISTLNAQSLSTVSERRSSEPRRMVNVVRGELDWIVMKALEKDRERRYESAASFAADIERYLNDDPVQACPPSRVYRFRKFVRKHQGAVVATMLVVVALLTGTGIATWQAVEATQARKLADNRLSVIDHERKQAEKNFESALKAVDQMLTRVANQLKDVPQTEELRKSLSSDALKFYEGFLEEHSSDPRVRFQMGLAYDKMGLIYRTLNQLGQAEKAFDQAIQILQELAESTPEKDEYAFNLATAFSRRGVVLEEAGRFTEAEHSHRQALAITRKQAVEFPDRYGKWVAGRLTNLGIMLTLSGRLAEAESVHREALAIRIKTPQSIGPLQETYSNLGNVYYDLGRPVEATQAWQQAVDLDEKLVASSPNNQSGRVRLGADRSNLSIALKDAGNFPEAEDNLRRALAIFEKLVMDFPNTPEYRSLLASQHDRLASILKMTGRIPEAEDFYRKALAIDEQLVVEFPNTPSYRASSGAVHHNLGELFLMTDRPADSAKAFQLAQDILEKLASEFPDNPEYRCWRAGNLGSLGLALLAMGHHDEADAAGRESVELAERVVADFPKVSLSHHVLASAHGYLGLVQYRRDDFEAAAASLKKGLELNKGRELTMEEKEEETRVWFCLAMALWQLDQKEEARMSHEHAVQWMESNSPQNDAQHEELRRFRAEAAELLHITDTSKPEPKPPTNPKAD